MADKESRARQIRRALQLFVSTLTDESDMMEVADIYPAYSVDTAYKTGDVFSYGVNQHGKTQLYQVVQAHTSVSASPPPDSPSLYRKIGYSQGSELIQ